MVTRLLAILTLAVILVSCSQDEPSTESRQMTQLEQQRAEKDEYFRDGEYSPLSEDDRTDFSGLTYFPEDSSFVVSAQFSPSDSQETFKMATTKDDLRDAYRAGTLSFSINNTPCTLTAFRFVGSDHPTYFVPFTDATSGNESYATGRYIDLEILEGASKYVIDFNVAYNPYCAYNDKYSCPLVPTENALSVAINAGEKAWEAH